MAVEESVFETLRIKRYGRLVVLLTPAMKIISYDFNMLGYDYSIPQPVILHELGTLMHQFQQYQLDAMQTDSSDALKSHEVMQIAMTAIANLGHGFEAEVTVVLWQAQHALPCFHKLHCLHSSRSEVTAVLWQAQHALLCLQLLHMLHCLYISGSAHHEPIQHQAMHQKLPRWCLCGIARVCRQVVK